MHVAGLVGVARCCPPPQQDAHDGVGHGQDGQRNDVGDEEDEHGEGPARAGRGPHFIARDDHPAQPVGPLRGPAHEQLHGGQRHGAQPDGHQHVLGPVCGHARAQREHDDEEAVRADGHVGEDTGGHGEVLHEEDDGAHGLGEDPGLHHDEGESEGHAEERHHQVGHGQVDEEGTDVGAAAPAAGEDEDDEDVAGDGEQRGEGVQHDQRRLGPVRQHQRLHRRRAVVAAAEGRVVEAAVVEVRMVEVGAISRHVAESAAVENGLEIRRFHFPRQRKGFFSEGGRLAEV